MTAGAAAPFAAVTSAAEPAVTVEVAHCHCCPEHCHLLCSRDPPALLLPLSLNLILNPGSAAAVANLLMALLLLLLLLLWLQQRAAQRLSQVLRYLLHQGQVLLQA
jgi:hypothetical protein